MSPPTHSLYGFSPKHRSGIDVIDDTWGGLYRGGSYLIYGREMSGRALLALMLCKTGIAQQEKTLFISSDRQKDLFIQAASIGLDLKAAHESGSVRVMRIPTLTDFRHDNDESVSQALTDLVDIIVRFQPERVILSDFIPLIAFGSHRQFQIEFVRFLERLDALNSTIILSMPEPGNDQSRSVIEFMGMQMTGSIHIELADLDPRSTKRRITLIPHIGHIRHRIVDYWDLEDLIKETPDVIPPVFRPQEVQVDEPTAAESSAESVRDSEESDSGNTESRGAETQSPDPVTMTVSPGLEPLDYSDAKAFKNRLQLRFDKRDSGGDPFLLLAMRMDRSGDKTIRPFDFDFLMDLVQAALKPGDDCFVNMEDERMIVCLSNSTEKDAQTFFARLKDNLRKESPQRADHLLHSVAAIVVPNGIPFKSADEFFTYAVNNNH